MEGFHTQKHLPYGNFITRIAKYYDLPTHHDLRELKCLDRTLRYLDLTRIYSARFIAVANNQMHHLTHDIKLIPLPWKTVQCKSRNDCRYGMQHPPA